MCKVISISNQKGGVGKTTTTINLGVSLTKLGKKALLLDLDPQSNLTMALGFPQPDELEQNIAKLLLNEINKRQSIKTAIDDNSREYILSTHGIDFIPASIELAGIENILINSLC